MHSNSQLSHDREKVERLLAGVGEKKKRIFLEYLGQKQPWTFVKSQTGHNILMEYLYCAKPADPDIVKFIVSQPRFNIDHRNKFGYTALLCATNQC